MFFRFPFFHVTVRFCILFQHLGYLFKFVTTPYQFKNCLYRLFVLHWLSIHKYLFEKKIIMLNTLLTHFLS